MNLDARLRRALQPVEPPDDFARRVRARVEAARATSAAQAVARGSGWRSWLATAAAVAGAVAIGAGAVVAVAAAGVLVGWGLYELIY